MEKTTHLLEINANKYTLFTIYTRQHIFLYGHSPTHVGLQCFKCYPLTKIDNFHPFNLAISKAFFPIHLAIK